MVTTDPLAWVRAEMDAADAVAEAARGSGVGVWSADAHPHYDGARVYDDQGEPVVLDDGSPTPEQAAHIARHDPAAVLRRIAADRKLLDDLLAERHLVNDGDCWYTCRAATEERDGGENCNDEERGKPCDCGRDTRVQRRVRLIAESWGWSEGAATEGALSP